MSINEELIFKSKIPTETWFKYVLCLLTSISVIITLLIVISVFSESLNFFSKISVIDFFFGTKWSPQTTISNGIESAGLFGVVPVFLGTFLVAMITMLFALPCGLYAAIYISEYSSNRFRNIVKPMLEILAGIPTVVYGYFAIITVAPSIKSFGESIGVNISSESALTAGFVMGIMVIPFILSLSEDAINSVPKSLREASLALGATKSETIMKVIIPAASPAIISAILLAISRAIGETMIVVMVAGLSANLTLNPLEPVTTITVQIVTLLAGDQEFDSIKTLAAFALGFSLFITTFMLNFIAFKISRRYAKKYKL